MTLPSELPTHENQNLRVLVAFEAEPDLIQLELLNRQFNIFEAIGVKNQELRHSDFLAFLLDPRQSHGLGDAFVTSLLREMLAITDRAVSFTENDLNMWSLEKLTVLRERLNIDLLLVDDENRLVIIIENKIGSQEHSGQLGRYLQIVRNLHPDYSVLPIFLSPFGTDPSDQAYLPLDYGLVAKVIEILTREKRETIDPAVHTVMTHYVRMLRRHVVTDSETAELCRRIYREHKLAIELILAHAPNRIIEIRDYLIELIEATPEVVYEGSPKVLHIQFAVQEWDRPWLLSARNWTKSNRALLFQFSNSDDWLGLDLVLGPAPSSTRSLLLDHAFERMPPFRVLERQSKRWTVIFRKDFLTAEQVSQIEFDEVQRQIREKWLEFLETDLPALLKGLDVENLVPPQDF